MWFSEFCVSLALWDPSNVLIERNARAEAYQFDSGGKHIHTKIYNIRIQSCVHTNTRKNGEKSLINRWCVHICIIDFSLIVVTFAS